ncbi:ATP-binding protein [Pseudanabaena sp. FACHB-1277]|uniref:site-specific DNA-methyltransferase (adenine-specific) n=1 Tax=Pseudanabaena cinerea FACHB-1277 TaxID=2949581 RepID=A0A926USB0_9CYAN|nr:DNA methyltransferase [Pseudanabaena cinerea]MBD2150179.1 ATP-binding protein [Pseudanabaena cinerea FACHB-1277]
MAINLKKSRQYLQDFDFSSLFIEELGWSNPPSGGAIAFKCDGKTFYRRGVAELAGVLVLEVTAEDGEIPDGKVRANVHKEICKLALENLVIFLDGDRQKSLWYWVKREGTKQYRRDHLYVKGQSGDLFLSKLGALVVDISDWDKGTVSVITAARRLRDSFDIDRVTKKFFSEFQDLHGDFLELIENIELESDRRWYASILLNRLMFVYFLQRKYFLDNGDELYLQNKLKVSKQTGDDCFYREFLQPLFFEGFGKPEGDRADDVKKKIGKIRYLNGGLFLPHGLEKQYPNISISDRAFEQVLDLFSRYSWNLDDTPEGKDDEINPDVLGYIFEKYINQKEFGAYYTRPEITEYLCDRTINKLILDKVAGKADSNLNELLLRLDANLCDRLLNHILPNLTLLDPACGSGAFLVAAMKTLIGVYATVVSQARRFVEDPHPLAPSPKKGEGEQDPESSLTPLSPLGRGAGGEGLKKWLDEANSHPSLDYYIKKRIITDNLYGVDIMQEATEIAKLRLFLALVASAKKVDELEPLPNIDFNIMAGNSLIGLIRVNADAFAKGSQGTLENQWTSDLYNQILNEKNRDIALYKKHSFLSDSQRNPDHRSQESSVAELRNQIEKLNTESQVKLNDLLLNEFSSNLKIKFEEAQLTGKPIKRVLNINDINVLEPFHWGYHFDRVFERGGFDAIIANPPWEIFKPQAKEFFAHHSELVTKNKMDIKTFEKEQKKLLESPDVAIAWLEYQSKFPYVSSYFRSAEDYKNQISIVNGKKAGTDINLYKLFLERCYHLLRKGGECGIVIPSGIYTDLGTKQLREMLFSETEITGLFCFENRKAIFEGVDSRFKFIILTFEKGSKTESFPTRFMRHDVTELANFPTPDDIRLDIPLIRKLSPDSLSIMEFKGEIEYQIMNKIAKHPTFDADNSLYKNLKFSREIAPDLDREYIKDEPAKNLLPLLEGKMIHQFNAYFNPEVRFWMSEKDARKTILGKNADIGQKLDYQVYRLGFRKIARNTDIRTMISTVIPPKLCIENLQTVNMVDAKGDLITSYAEILILCSIWNSFVYDFLLRMKVTANINFFFVYNTQVPRLQKGDKWFDAIVTRAAKLICTTPEFDELAKEVGLAPKAPHPLAPSPKTGEGGQESSLTPLSPLGRGAGGEGNYGVTNEIERGKLRAELDGIIAHIYGLTEEEFQYILTTFPIVPDPVKLNALNAYRDVRTGLIKGHL